MLYRECRVGEAGGDEALKEGDVEVVAAAGGHREGVELDLGAQLLVISNLHAVKDECKCGGWYDADTRTAEGMLVTLALHLHI